MKWKNTIILGTDPFLDNNLAQVTYSNAVIATPSVAFTYDTNYNRMATMSDGIGTTTYGYYPVVVGQLGAGRLASVTGLLPNSTVTYSYDELGRVSSRAINGVAQAMTYDALGRVTIVTNALGSFTNVYVRATGLIATNLYPNGQQTVFSYYGTNNDERLQQIQNLTPAGQNLSSFGYAYDANSQITNWTEQADNNTPTVQVEEYDPVNQLISSTVHSGTIAGTILKQFIYQYDAAGNRTSEQIGSAGVPPAISSSSFNNVNQLTSRTGNSGPIRFRGTLNETGTVMVAGSPGTMTSGTNFAGNANVSSGTNVVSVVATDYSNHRRTNNYQVVVTNNGVDETLTYDLDGNLVSSVTATSTNTYQWDAANRLVSITGPTNQSLFTYDGLSRRAQIVELQSSVPVSTNLYLWCGAELCEQRDLTGGTVTKQFFAQGEQISGSNYYFTQDHLGSIREMTDGSGTVKARYDYDPYGRRTKVSGSMDADSAYVGYYYHAVSGLYLTLFRTYDSDFGRWLNRDPIGEEGGINLYTYVENNPVNLIDPLGLDTCTCDRKIGGGPAKQRGLFWNTTPKYSHTFVFTTNPDGTVKHTYSWGNNANTHGWNLDQPEDIAAAKEALKNGYNWNEGGKDLDPFIDQAYHELDKKENEHQNLGVARNCKTEAQKLLDKARAYQKACQCN